MITRELAGEHVARFGDLLPRTQASTDALVEAFCEAAQDEKHAECIRTRLVRTLHYPPVPADVYEAAVAVVTEGRWVPERRACEHCHGDGFTHEERDGISIASLCPHCRGAVKRAGV